MLVPAASRPSGVQYLALRLASRSLVQHNAHRLNLCIDGVSASAPHLAPRNLAWLPTSATGRSGPKPSSGIGRSSSVSATH